MFQFLVVGSAGAVGAAMFVGTAAALVRFRRTGAFPGGDGGTPVEPSRGRIVGLWVRAVVGLALAVWAAVSLQSAGLLL